MKNLTILAFLLCISHVFSQTDSTDTGFELDEEIYLKILDSINNSYTFQKGTIQLGNDLATLHVPEGFKYLDGQQSQRVLTELWGNPPSETLGMLFPEEISVLGDDFTYAIEITYSEEGYIDDDDADDIDYDDLLEDMQESAIEENEERKKQGYPTAEIVGWAAEPFYDHNAKKLHWAKEIKFEGMDMNTLNYNIRVLGRKGYLNLNAISDMDKLHLVQNNIDRVISSAEFNPGKRYSDFDPDFDEVAAYGIGGLIAGKVLAKVGFFAALLKFWKIIAVGVVAAFGTLRKRLFGSKNA
ncbi:DUF2167 domain-containing protein [Flagellimonas pelagia]|uniref:DUF2167 domain-containing protein n=1 Tax=Flagellimonas pelagia TaxID=2306998 RepID=A0A3A1NM25_9FLAO|nr:DUF2167 domain-containing protein [Allomuricauda maritima]RIV45937.1 DUF2167 domain-containing protein [Allomuricauda maritima]TXJ98698.1 DUF2167 domain-containing protein [Allomuricauda maritima]